MTSEVDVTSQIKFGTYDADGEALPIKQCVCGEEFGHWDFVVSIYSDSPKECPKCHRKFFFRSSIRVYEVKDE